MRTGDILDNYYGRAFLDRIIMSNNLVDVSNVRFNIRQFIDENCDGISPS
jgi:hypothetical protein